MLTCELNLGPLLGFPVEQVDLVEPLFVFASSSEEHESVIDMIIVECAVGAMRWHLASSFDFPPFHLVRIENPQVVHVNGI